MRELWRYGGVMQGYQLTFYTLRDRRQDDMPIADWLMQEAKALGIPGATMATTLQGFGRDGELHSWRFFELTGQPVVVTMALTSEQAERLLGHMREANVNIFYIRTPVEFGMSAEP